MRMHPLGGMANRRYTCGGGGVLFPVAVTTVKLGEHMFGTCQVWYAVGIPYLTSTDVPWYNVAKGDRGDPRI